MGNFPGAAKFGVVQKAQSIFDATRKGSIRLLLTPSKRMLVSGCAHVSPGEQL